MTMNDPIKENIMKDYKEKGLVVFTSEADLIHMGIGEIVHKMDIIIGLAWLRFKCII